MPSHTVVSIGISNGTMIVYLLFEPLFALYFGPWQNWYTPTVSTKVESTSRIRVIVIKNSLSTLK